MAKVRLSKTFTLQVPDFVRGAILAVATPALVVVQDWIDKESEPFSWKLLVKVSIAALVSYLFKNYLEPAKVIVTGGNNKKAEKVAEDIKEAV